MDWTMIITSCLGIIGTVSAAVLTNWLNTKNQKELGKIELSKQKEENAFQLKKEILSNELNRLISVFNDFSSNASRLRYSGDYYRDIHYKYLDAYNKATTITDNPKVLSAIDSLNKYLMVQRTNNLSFDAEFEKLLSNANLSFREEIQLHKEKILHKQ